MLVVVFAFSSVGANCTATQVAADINAVANAASLGCTVLTAVDGSVAGQVCGDVVSDVTAVTALIQGLITKVSAAALKASPGVITAPPVVWKIGTTQVTLRPDVAAAVKTQAAQAVVGAPH